MNTGDSEGVVLYSLEAACDVAEKLSVNRIIAICCSCPLRIIIALHVVFLPFWMLWLLSMD